MSCFFCFALCSFITHADTRFSPQYRTKTPGGKLVVQYTGKSSKGATNPKYLGGAPLNGIKRLGSQKRHNAIKFAKTVNRPYGGVLSHDIVREKIVRAFLIEEQKIVKKVMKVKKAPKPAAK